MDIYSRSISKRGSASLRRTLFLLMRAYLQNAPVNESVYQKIDLRGKPYKVYMMASANKFLRIFYASVKARGVTLLLYLRTATIFNRGCEVAWLSACIPLCVYFLNFYLTFVSRSYS